MLDQAHTKATPKKYLDAIQARLDTKAYTFTASNDCHTLELGALEANGEQTGQIQIAQPPEW